MTLAALRIVTERHLGDSHSWWCTVSNCPGVHCPGCGGKAGAAVAALAGLGVTAWLVFEFFWAIALVAGVTAAGAVAMGAWVARYGADLAVVSRGALPAPEATPIPSRAPQALQGPQVHYHLHLHDAQAAGAAVRNAITQRREP